MGFQNQSSCYSIAVLIRGVGQNKAVIMGAIADSSTATWITFECCCKITTYNTSVRASVLVYIKDLIPKVPMLTFFRSKRNCKPTDSKAKGVTKLPVVLKTTCRNPEIQNSEYSSRKQLKSDKRWKRKIFWQFENHWVPARINGRYQNS
jgi:hypothetical protein